MYAEHFALVTYSDIQFICSAMQAPLPSRGGTQLWFDKQSHYRPPAVSSMGNKPAVTVYVRNFRR
jgi:hypothetical protein